MSILRMKEIRALGPEQLKAKVSELRVELMKLETTVKAGGKVDNPARVKEVKKLIARILTILNQEKSSSRVATKR